MADNTSGAINNARISLRGHFDIIRNGLANIRDVALLARINAPENKITRMESIMTRLEVKIMAQLDQQSAKKSGPPDSNEVLFARPAPPITLIDNDTDSGADSSEVDSAAILPVPIRAFEGQPIVAPEDCIII